MDREGLGMGDADADAEDPCGDTDPVPREVRPPHTVLLGKSMLRMV